LLDRAESVFNRLETGVHALDALRNILEIQVLTKDWHAAIATASRLEKLGCPAQNADTAHYYCELASAAMLKGDVDTARAELTHALQENKRSARAWLLSGDLEVKIGADAAAIAAWRRLEEVNPAYLPIVAERLTQAYVRGGQQAAAIDLLKAYLERRPSPDLLHFLFQTVAQAEGWERAKQLAADELKRHPSLRALDDYLQASNAIQQREADVEGRLAQDLVHRQVSRSAYYLCTSCGFKARQYFWQCPACARWESISPEREEHD
jgi:lipopolysaccharide biosynthesis regulator YciM